MKGCHFKAVASVSEQTARLTVAMPGHDKPLRKPAGHALEPGP